MSKLLVVDASVVVKWLPAFKQEVLVAEALDLLQRWRQGSVDLLAPDLLWAEAANVHWRAARQNRCLPSDAQASLASLHGHGVPTVPVEDLVDEALRIALLSGRTAYDSLYVALAARLSAQLITADEKLANAIAGSFPVKWLGAI
jgi:predicted nucleic acid-binding protein